MIFPCFFGFYQLPLIFWISFTNLQQTLISKVEEFRGYIDFVGGFDDAERRLCRVRDNEYCNDEGLPIKLYSVISSNAEFTHRDILGSLMGLGIKREMIGDIIINEDKAQFFCHNSISEFVEFNLKKSADIMLKSEKAKAMKYLF